MFPKSRWFPISPMQQVVLFTIVMLWLANLPHCNAQATSGRSMSATDAFTTISPSRIIRESREVIDMPKIANQGPVGSCFGCAAATIVQKFICDHDPIDNKKNTPCSQTPLTRVVSQLSMVAWADTNEPKGATVAANRGNTQVPGVPGNHTNIKLYSDMSIYSSTTNALLNSQDAFTFMPEFCFPIDNLYRKYGNGNPAIFEQVYAEMHVIYEQNRLLPSGLDPVVVEQLSDMLNAPLSVDAVITGLSRKTFGEFFYTLVFHHCKPFSTNVRPNFRSLGREAHIQRADALALIIRVLDQQIPVAVTNLCLATADGACISTHSTVVSGYRTACVDSTCTTQLKVHNCWGIEWQSQNDDGWVNANNFMKNMSLGEPYLDGDQINWLEELL